jgi:hypothetical protein
MLATDTHGPATRPLISIGTTEVFVRPTFRSKDSSQPIDGQIWTILSFTGGGWTLEWRVRHRSGSEQNFQTNPIRRPRRNRRA